MSPTNSSHGHALPRLETSFSASIPHSPLVTSSTSTNAIPSASTDRYSPSLYRHIQPRGTASWPSSATSHNFDSTRSHSTTSADGLTSGTSDFRAERGGMMPTIEASEQFNHQRTSSLKQQTSNRISDPISPSDSAKSVPNTPSVRPVNAHVFTNNARVSKPASHAQPIRTVKAPKQRRRDNSKIKPLAPLSQVTRATPRTSGPGPNPPSSKTKAPSPSVLQAALETQTQIIASISRQIRSASVTNVAIDTNLSSPHITTNFNHVRHSEMLALDHFQTGSFEHHSLQPSSSPLTSSSIWPSSASIPYPPPWPSTPLQDLNHTLSASTDHLEAQFSIQETSSKLMTTPVTENQMPPPMTRHPSLHSSSQNTFPDEGILNTFIQPNSEPDAAHIGLGVEIGADVMPAPTDSTQTSTGHFMPIISDVGIGTLSDTGRPKGRVLRPWN